MASTGNSAELTKVGPATVMGELMRQYWIPAALSSELTRDGAPLRLMLLGEKLVAFRDSAGRVGVIDHRCPHRCASLFLGRNEAGGLRCIYHGWKFGTDGRCVDMPNVPQHHDFKRKVRAKAYATMERAGIIWAYMGAADAAPPMPALEVLCFPAEEVGVRCIQRDCNYLQALEGDIDTSHFGFLHAGHVDINDVPEDHPIHHTLTNRAPEYHVADTAWGTQYAAYRRPWPHQLAFRQFPVSVLDPTTAGGIRIAYSRARLGAAR
jgi:phenylpropionate dioxygenase-like ring-hydroxylating dioxygenase large terminal subunit